jgi:hypothetical protein
MRSILVMLIAIALLVVPALAFDISGYDFSSIEDEDQAMVSDSGTYTFNRVVVDEGGEFSEQDAYSGLIFGADEVDKFRDPRDNLLVDAETAGIVANKVKTAATDVNSEITRQYLQQKGTAYVLLKPGDADYHYDPEVTAPTTTTTVNIGFTKSNLAWVSGDLATFKATPASYAVAGGNGMDAVPEELSPNCKNAWLYEQEDEAPITVTANGESRLLDAYAGSASNANLVMTQSFVGSEGTFVPAAPATAKMSGYAERFAGYTDAFADTAGESNNIVIDFGTTDAGDAATVEHFWNTGTGIVLDAPESDDFPNYVPVYENGAPTGQTQDLVTWPNNIPGDYEPDAVYNPVTGEIDHFDFQV